MQLHEFMCPDPVQIKADLDLAKLIQKHSSNLCMGLDFAEQKLYFKHGNFDFSQAEDKSIFGKYKPWPQHAFFAQMMASVNQPVQIISDFEDCRGALQEVLLGGQVANVFCYNRKRGIGREILWQRAGFFEPNEYLGFSRDGAIKDTTPFEQKISQVFWRGGLNGSNWIDNRNRDSVLSIKTIEDFYRARYRYSRIHAVLYSEQNPTFTDFKLTGDAAFNIVKGRHESLHSASVKRDKILEYKYILCPNGNDVSTQFYWAIGSNSVAFKEECEYEIVPDYYLKPWIHYVPLAKGLIDIKEKFDYMEKNPGLALQIIENANKAYQTIIAGKEWKEAELTVLQRLNYLK